MLCALQKFNYYLGDLMSFQFVRIVAVNFLLLLSLFAFASNLPAQAPTGGLHGVVTDPSGAVIAKAAVRLTNAGGASLDATTNRDGIYEFKDLAPGAYSLKAVAKGFALFTQDDVTIVAGQVLQLNIGLLIQIEEQKVEVTDTTTKVDIDPSSNAGMVVMKGKDLEALSDDPDELQSELQALAGPSAGPNGGQIYIDGFTAGQLPPKASIREIRINQNPFSSEYDKLGYGRVEILTKPGTDSLHGQASITGNTDAFNSRNPFQGTAQAPGYYSTQYSANLGGSLGKKASFFTNIERRNLNELSVVNTPTVDPTTFEITQFAGAVPNPRTRTNFSQRFDYQITPGNTLTARYQYWRNNESGDGIGNFSLPSVGYNSLNTENTFQMTDTQVLSARTINETRFQFVRENSNQNPLNTVPTVQIQGASTSGGSSSGLYNDIQNRYEVQNITYMTFGKHSIKYGGRVRATKEDYSSNGAFNGSYSFGSRVDPTVPGCAVPKPPATCPQISGIVAYQITLQALAAGNTPANMALAIANGGGASFYAVNSNTVGSAVAQQTWVDGALFLQDDWRVKPTVTVSYGLRYETQNNLGDHADFAPRLGIAWAIDGGGKNKSPKTVLRLGYGIFYDRFSSNLVLQQQLQNGIIQTQSLVQSPTFFDPTTTVLPPFSQSAAGSQTIYVPNSNLRTPYTMQTGVTLERQLTKTANLSVTYLHSRGLHQFYTNFINAEQIPPGEISAPAPAVINYQYQSAGDFKQNQLIVNSSIRMGAKLSLFGYYTLNYANSDTSGASSIPSDPFNLSADFGRASFDVRHRIFFGGTIGLPYAFRLSPFMIASSGPPFNVTTGQDLYGNAAFNTRATVGTCSSGATGVKDTPYGCFNLTTLPGQPVVPINDETGPGRFTLNLRLSKTFGFGAKKEAANAAGQGGPGGGGTFVRGPGGPGGGGHGGGGDRGGGGMFGGAAPTNYRYNLTFSVNARNIFNNVNVANPIGNLSSKIFGESNALAGGPFGSSTNNRKIDLQLSFNF
jgi:hypothetical protein